MRSSKKNMELALQLQDFSDLEFLELDAFVRKNLEWS